MSTTPTHAGIRKTLLIGLALAIVFAAPTASAVVVCLGADPCVGVDDQGPVVCIGGDCSHVQAKVNNEDDPSGAHVTGACALTEPGGYPGGCINLWTWGSTCGTEAGTFYQLRIGVGVNNTIGVWHDQNLTCVSDLP